MELTINLPESIVQRLKTIADSTNQPIGDLVLQSISSNLPPDVDSAPPEMRTELLQMQTLSVEELQQVASSQILKAHQAEHFELLEKNQEGDLIPIEQDKLNQLRQLADQRMLRKAYACAMLRWCGRPIRSIEQLSMT
ncbi:MAG: hypothetical protein WBB01_21360 [Phormidesmis sp.]